LPSSSGESNGNFQDSRNTGGNLKLRYSKQDSSIREGHSVKMQQRICGNKKENGKKEETACNKEFHSV
jgi:hypothetical protein